MKNWSIDRLALTVPGYSEHQAHELAQSIADALVEVATVPTRAPADAEYANLKLELPARQGEAMPALARRIVAALATIG